MQNSMSFNQKIQENWLAALFFAAGDMLTGHGVCRRRHCGTSGRAGDEESRCTVRPGGSGRHYSPGVATVATPHKQPLG
ncbi:hypothetical protein L484_015461 [Morus notabilis]|uniref:Uncharacterized protein n=1 Tax=Morus notabilis TaxID=981085 RepID=W9RHP8_9ROSA|nr:hypothetical protein L484_015461 [Morus notabilis]